jgi:hypothetical protein
MLVGSEKLLFVVAEGTKQPGAVRCFNGTDVCAVGEFKETRMWSTHGEARRQIAGRGHVFCSMHGVGNVYRTVGVSQRPSCGPGSDTNSAPRHTNDADAGQKTDKERG